MKAYCAYYILGREGGERWLGIEIITVFIEQNSTKSAIRNPLSCKKLLWKIGGNFESFWPLLPQLKFQKNKAVTAANLIWLKIRDFLCFYESRLWMVRKRQWTYSVFLTNRFLVVWILLIIKAISLGLSMKLKNAVMREI